MSIASCSVCICRNCLLWWSDRCPYGECFDDYRAEATPYDKAHPNEPPRKLWSEWNRPGEQAHWCRGGSFYPIQAVIEPDGQVKFDCVVSGPPTTCEHHIQYQRENTKVMCCFDSNVVVYQDGYIQCSIIDSIGCQECWRRFQENRKRTLTSRKERPNA